IAFFPILYVSGYQSLWHLGVGTLLGAVMALLGIRAVRDTIVPIARISFALSTLLIALYARMVTPFLAAPCIAVVAAMIVATHPKIARPPVLAIVLVVAVLGPWLLELVGALSETTSITGNTIVLRA